MCNRFADKLPEAAAAGKKHEVIINMVHSVMYGQNERKSYSKIQEILEMPNLIAVQIIISKIRQIIQSKSVKKEMRPMRLP